MKIAGLFDVGSSKARRSNSIAARTVARSETCQRPAPPLTFHTRQQYPTNSRWSRRPIRRAVIAASYGGKRTGSASRSSRQTISQSFSQRRLLRRARKQNPPGAPAGLGLSTFDRTHFLGANKALARATHVTVRHSGIRHANLLHHRRFGWTFRHSGGSDHGVPFVISLIRVTMLSAKHTPKYTKSCNLYRFQSHRNPLRLPPRQ